jgi:ATP-binding cassette subfamily C (CFTR/MRP) protein 1
MLLGLIELSLICVGSSYMATTVPFTFVAIYFIQRFYLRTSRQLRLLDLEARSPLFKHFTETIEGLVTIRAFGWQTFFTDTALASLDASQRPYYLLTVIQRWLTIVLDITVSAMGVIVVALAVLRPESTTSGSIGVALTSIVTFNSTLAQFIMQWTQAEMLLGAVTRTRELERDTPQEEDGKEKSLVPEDWPVGAVDIRGLSVEYQDGTVALTNATFNAGAGQKVGIVGRTGRQVSSNAY